MLCRKLTKDVRGYMQKCVDKGKEINLTSSINKETISRGLRCVLLGGWGGAGARTARAGKDPGVGAW